MNQDITSEKIRRPLVVDLDYSLIATDVTFESLLLLMKHHPFQMFLTPFWLMRGKVSFKNKLVNKVCPDVSLLPLNSHVADFVRAQRNEGRRIILATASHQIIADRVAEHTGLFDSVIATSNSENVGSAGKVRAIRGLIGDVEFDYIGDRSADVPVWLASHDAIAVNPAASLEKSLGRNFDKVFNERMTSYKSYLSAIRIHQWLKNSLLFLPLLLAHQFLIVDKVIESVLAFASFSVCASGVYVLNDLLDLEADRRHPRKKLRPFASGLIPVYHGLFMLPLLFLSGFILSLALPERFTFSLIIYILLTTAYSFYFKRIAIVDVLFLAGLYAFRVLSGALAVTVGISTWMLAFSMFMFLSLAFVKRYSELLLIRVGNSDNLQSRGYRVGDADLLRSVGTAAGYISVLVLALYINSNDVIRLYSHPKVLWLIEPLLLYWITRVWYIAHRGEMHDDPVVFALEDRTSYLVAVVAIVIVTFASLPFELFSPLW